VNEIELTKLMARCDAFSSKETVSELVFYVDGVLTNEITLLKAQQFELLRQAAGVIAASVCSVPADTCVRVLLSIALAHVPRSTPEQGLHFALRAYEIAIAYSMREQERRSLNVCSSLCIYMGAQSDAVEYGLQSAKIARELNYELAVVNSLGNVTAALHFMGLHLESVSLALRVVKRYGDQPEFAGDLAIALGNMGNAALALRQYGTAVDAAGRAMKSFTEGADSQNVLNRMATETIWLKGAIGLDHRTVVEERLKAIDVLAESFDAPRVSLNRQLAHAAYDIYRGRYVKAFVDLGRLREATVAFPTLYIDAMQLLINAAEKLGDHAAALQYLGEATAFLGQSQLTKVRALLSALDEKASTPIPGKDVAQSLIDQLPNDALITSIASSARIDELPDLIYRDAIERLAISAELRDDPTGHHIYRVGKLAGLLAREVGYSEAEAEVLDYAARLHDIGKLGILSSILAKFGRFNDAEYEAMQAHAETGAKILNQCAHPAFRLAAEIALNHHETWEGTGYPKQLAGDTIPESARIVALAEVYDALTNARTFKHAWPHADAMAYMKSCAGSHFEPRLTDAFCVLIERLRREHGAALDEFLTQSAQKSAFVKTRSTMQSMINDLVPATNLAFTF
jgi:putative two-component system response regulator